MVCKTLKVLPSSPDVKKLTMFQINWIIENIIIDAKDETKAYKKAMGDDSIGYDIRDDWEDTNGGEELEKESLTVDSLAEILREKREQQKKEKAGK